MIFIGTNSKERMSSNNTDGLFHGMVFRMRICTTRARIKKVLEENGGRLIKSGEKAASIIHLTDDIQQTQGIHVNYIIHSVQMKSLQSIEKYDLSKPTNTSNIVKVDAKTLGKARQAYQPEEDDAILQYVTKHRGEFGSDGSTGGNLIWKTMEKDEITSHTWQSMKSRYNTHLQHRVPSFPYQPITLRNCGASAVAYAVSRDSPQSDVDSVVSQQPVEKKKTHGKKHDPSSKKKIKKLYSFSENTALYAKTPPAEVAKTIVEEEKSSQEVSQNISEVSSPDVSKTTSPCETVPPPAPPSQEQQNRRQTFLFESFSGEASCDGIIHEGNGHQHQQQGNNIESKYDDDDDETQSITCSPDHNLPLRPRYTSTVSKTPQQPHSNTMECLRMEFTESEEEFINDDDDEFDQLLLQQAAQQSQEMAGVKEGEQQGTQQCQQQVRMEGHQSEKTKKRKSTSKKKTEQQKEEEEEDDEFDIKPCKCALSKDYTEAFNIIETIANLPEDFNWKAVYDRIDF